YGLGLTVLEQLLGGAWFAMLFPGVQVRAQRWDEWHRSDEVLPPLAELLPEAPSDLAEVMAGLLRKSPEDRLSAAAALAILCPPPPPPAPRPEPPTTPVVQAVAEASVIPPPPRRRRARLARAVGTSLVAAGLGAGLASLASRGSGQGVVPAPVRAVDARPVA